MVMVDMGNVLFITGIKNESAPANNSRIPLAATRTHRIDPSRDFNYYDEGWDLTNGHYFMV